MDSSPLAGASPSFCTQPCHLGFATETLFSPLLCLQFLRSPLASLACSLPYGPTTPQPVMPPALSLVWCTSVFDCSSTTFAVPFTVCPASSPMGFLIAGQCPRLAALLTLYPSNLRFVDQLGPLLKGLSRGTPPSAFTPRSQQSPLPTEDRKRPKNLKKRTLYLHHVIHYTIRRYRSSTSTSNQYSRH